MPARDYYEILGLKRGATPDEIKRAYRKLARQLHPDVNKASDAAERFAEVQEAYDVLSDDDKRQQYDMFGRAGVSGAAGRAGAGQAPGPGWSGGNVHFESDFGDLNDLGSVFDAFFGRGGRSQGTPRGQTRAHRAPRKGRDIRAQMTIDLETVASGGSRTLRVREGDRDRTIEVSIPPGVSTGQSLRIRGEGEPGAGGERGDLLVEVRVADHALFRRGQPGRPDDDSLDLWFELPLTIWEAIHGARVDVPTLDGAVQLTIPGGTSSGRSLRLKARGLSGRSGEKGDLYALVQVMVPKPDVLTPGEARTIEDISNRGGPIRSDRIWKGK